MATVTEKSKKSDIWDELQDRTKELRAARRDSKGSAKKEEVRTAQLELDHADVQPGSAIAGIAELKTRLGSELSTLSDQLESATETLADRMSLIGIKDEELKEIYNIEREADTLLAIAETGKALEARNEASRVATMAKWNAEAAERQTRWGRENEQHSYEFNRKVLTSTNSFNDGLDKERKQHDAKCADESKKISALREQVKDDQAKVDLRLEELSGVEERHAEEIEAAKKEASSKAKSAAHFENTIAQKDLSAQIKILNGDNSSLKGQLAIALERNAKLENQVNASMEKVQHVALGAITGADHAKTIGTLEEALKASSAAGNGKNR